MSFETLYEQLVSGAVKPEEAAEMLKEQGEKFRYYKDRSEDSHPLSDREIQELSSIVRVLQYLYDTVGSPVNDITYDIYEELLVNVGIPRNTSSIEPMGSKKSHQYTNLRGTLDKVYAVRDDQERANKSRKSLDEWIKSAEAKYEKATGKKIDLNDYDILITPKFDGLSAIEEISEKKNGNREFRWLTRGDTQNNRATDVTHIMHEMNGAHNLDIDGDFAVKYEVMITEGDFKQLNKMQEKPYKNSRQTAVSILNSTARDYRADYLYPVPLRYMRKGDAVEQIHPDLLEIFPTLRTKLGDRDGIESFAQNNRYVDIDGRIFRTDGAVITILDPKVQRVLGRENNINKFEVAYKFTEEAAYSHVRDVEFYVSDFGIVTPVVVVDDVYLKGNCINHISLSNYGRFKELGLRYGDVVKVLYDIIPYVTVDKNCRRSVGKVIPFAKRCPTCHHQLDLDGVVARCMNPECPSKLMGRVLHYCRTLRMKSIGWSTINVLHEHGLLKHGIASLYKLKKERRKIEYLPGFGDAKIFNILREIKARTVLKDYEFFGAIGIEGMSVNTFKKIFDKIPGSSLLKMIENKSWDLMRNVLISVPGIGDNKAFMIEEFFKDPSNLSDFKRLLKEVTIVDTGGKETLGDVVFSGYRPKQDIIDYLAELGYEATDRWRKSAKYLVTPSEFYSSSKVDKAKKAGVPIVHAKNLDELKHFIK